MTDLELLETTDAGRVRSVLAPFLSLRAEENTWRDFLWALYMAPEEALAAAWDIAAEATPEEGEIWPLRALASQTPDGDVQFETPMGVKITFRAGSPIHVDFGRDSHCLARKLVLRGIEHGLLYTEEGIELLGLLEPNDEWAGDESRMAALEGWRREALLATLPLPTPQIPPLI